MPAHPKLSLAPQAQQGGNSVFTYLLAIAFCKVDHWEEKKYEACLALSYCFNCVSGSVYECTCRRELRPHFPPTSSEAGACLLLQRPGWSSPWGFPVSVSHPAGEALGLQMWVTVQVWGPYSGPHTCTVNALSTAPGLFPHTPSKSRLASAESVISSP